MPLHRGLGCLWLAVAMSLAGCVSSPVTTEIPTGSNPTGPIASTQASPDGESEGRKRARIRTELAMNYYAKGQMQVALEELRIASNADSSFADVYNAYGLVYMALNERAQAEANFQRALSLAPADPTVNNNYGWFLCQTDRAAQSIRYFQTALRDSLYQTPAVAARSAGICSIRMNDLTAAQDFLQRSFQADPSNATTMFHLADVLYRRGEYDRARFYAQRLNRQVDVTAQTLWLELRIEHARGDSESERLLASQLARRFPDSREYSAWRRGEFND